MLTSGLLDEIGAVMGEAAERWPFSDTYTLREADGAMLGQVVAAAGDCFGFISSKGRRAAAVRLAALSLAYLIRLDEAERAEKGGER